jgi:glycosyltransferase involved in cell wall biosynthesis
MARMPFFSIITASLNLRDSIDRTIESICGQSFRSFEHIVIDGNSSDGTVQMLRDYQLRYPLHWISEPDSGISDAMNKGVDLSRGNYLLFIQADDCLLDSDILKKVHRLLKKEQYDIYSFPVIRERPGSTPFLYRPIRVPGWYHFKHTIPHQGAFVHRRLFKRIGGFREEFSITMDYDFFYRAFQARARIRYHFSPVSRMGGCGLSSGNRLLHKRIEEEKRVQETNELNPGWRALQAIFRRLYAPYKTNCTL